LFTGMITEVGTIIEAAEGLVRVQAPKVTGLLEPGSSVSVSGVCVTCTEAVDETFSAAVSVETARRSTLDELVEGTPVNVEVPLRVGDALGGHLVQGHVDAVGKVARVDEEGLGRRLWVRAPERFLAEVVAKGSVALDGVSLTVAEISRDRFSVALIPATLEGTTLASLAVGQRVNLESDLVGKLARRHAEAAGSALAAVIGSLPWAGRLTGRVGVEKVVAQIGAGGAVVVWDPAREGEGDVVLAGARVRPEAITFLLTQACGHTTVPCDLDRLERLEIPPLPGEGDRQGTAPHLSVDLAANLGTGVSPVERAGTIRRLAHPDARPTEFLRPGHVFPLGGRAGGLGERAGHTEASIALCQAAGAPPVAVICEVMTPEGNMAGLAELERFALRWGMPLVDIGDLITWL
jgi:3,4-dihydroxy 2-butanone 4-phosphate synthase